MKLVAHALTFRVRIKAKEPPAVGYGKPPPISPRWDFPDDLVLALW